MRMLLVDALVVLDAHENDYWQALCNTFELALPATIFEHELFHQNETLQNSNILRIEAELDEYDDLARRLHPDFLAALDPIELEALSILLSPKHPHLLFTTLDKAAVKALGMLGLGFRGISMEEVRKSMGLGVKKHEPHLTKNWFQKALCDGVQEKHLWLKREGF